jgi:hypothetical protein
MKADIYAELYLWNKNIDSVVRVLQRVEPLVAGSRELMGTLEIRVEELRSTLNVRVLDTLLRQERCDNWRLKNMCEALDQSVSRDTVQ